MSAYLIRYEVHQFLFVSESRAVRRESQLIDLCSEHFLCIARALSIARQRRICIVQHDDRRRVVEVVLLAGREQWKCSAAER